MYKVYIELAEFENKDDAVEFIELNYCAEVKTIIKKVEG